MTILSLVVWSVLLSVVLQCDFLLSQEVSPASVDSAMEAKMKGAWSEINEHWKLVAQGKVDESDDPQHAYAEEFFSYFEDYPSTPTGLRAGETSFMMWGNLGALDMILQTIPKVSLDSELWGRILTGIGNAHARHGKYPEYIEFLMEFREKVNNPKGLSEIELTLGDAHLRKDEVKNAQTCFQRVVDLDANQFAVQKAKSLLYEMANLEIGQLAPDFSAITIDNKSITLSQHRGKVVLLEFWATWCGPCKPEIPHLKQLHQELPASDFQIIGISQDKDMEGLERFLREEQINWPQILQVAEFENEILKQDEILQLYSVFGIPRSFLIDRDGKIAAKDLRSNRLEEKARELVKGVTTHR